MVIALRLMLDRVDKNLLPKCPIQVKLSTIYDFQIYNSNFQGFIGAKNLTVDPTVIKYFPLEYPTGRFIATYEFLSNKMEIGFFVKLHVNVKNSLSGMKTL